MNQAPGLAEEVWYDGASSGSRQEADQRRTTPRHARKGATLNLRTYQAHSLTEALTRIKADLGDHAVVLHSRTFRRGGVLGFGGRVVYEVTASPPAPRERPPASRERPSAPPTSRKTTPPRVAASRIAAPGTDEDSARAAAVALALAEQDRRRRLNHNNSPAEPTVPTTQPPARTPSIEVKLSRATLDPAPAAAGSGTAAAAQPPAPRLAAPPATMPVAKRYVLAPDINAGISHNTDRVAPVKTVARGPKPTRSNPAPPSPAAPSAEPALHNEIVALKQMVSQVLQRQSGTLHSTMPEALYTEYVSLIQNEVAQEIADELCDVVRRELTQAQLTDSVAVRDAFRTHLGRYIPIAPDSMLATPTDGRPFTLALIGPTGVGKTTTVAKLAAAFKLRHARRVGLITTDTYRIAAVDQLRTYANIIGIPLKVVLTPREMREACESLANCDVILIDTAGRSPNDASRLEEISDFAKAANPHEVHLVLSSTCSEQALMRTIERFSTVNADRVIFTKTDEAVSLGVLINVMHKAGKELSFITTGQEVPDHIEVGSPDRLAAMVLGRKGQG